MTSAISVFGVGKVGITLISAMLNKNIKVIGVDKNKILLNEIKNKNYISDEPGVQRILNKKIDLLTVTDKTTLAIKKTNFSFVIVPTNSNTLGGFSNKYIIQVLKSISLAIKEKKTYHTISIVSTIIPGSSEFELIPLIEKISGKKANRDFGFCYNPSFIAQGEIMKGIVTPDYVLIGENSKKSGKITEKVHKRILKGKVPMVKMNCTEAEITKIASNTHETMRVSFANMLAQICNEMPETNVDSVTNALTYRLGKRFFKGAVPYGGPCWPRDNIALSGVLNSINLNDEIPRVVDSYNLWHGDKIIELITKKLNKSSSVGIIGLAYKVGTNLITKSFSLKICNKLLPKVKSIVGYDPLASSNFKSQFKSSKFKIADDIEECLKTDICIIVQPINGLEKINYLKFKNTIIYDLWRIIPKKTSKKINNYFGFGISLNKNKNYKRKYNILKLTK